MRKVKFKSKRQLDARHEADRAVLARRAQRAREVTVSSSTVHPPTPEEIERFSVGGCGGGCKPQACPPPQTCAPPPMACTPNVSVHRPSSINDCYHHVAHKYGCPMKVTSGGQLNVDGQHRISFIVEPKQSNFFLPLFVRLSARARDDPDRLLIWRLTAVMINSKPQENYHDINPTADTLTGVESVAYDGKAAGDVPGWEVAWGPCARASQADRLELVGWNPYPAGTFMHPRAELWGYEIGSLPAGWQCGQHPGRVPLDANGKPVPSSSPLDAS